MKKEYYFDEEHPQSFVCSRECAERFDCDDRMNPFDLFYFLYQNLQHHNVKNDDGTWNTYLVIPERYEAEELEETILEQSAKVGNVMYFSGPRLFNGDDRYKSGWNFDPGDFLEASGFDRAMADDPSFELLDHQSDYVYR